MDPKKIVFIVFISIAAAICIGALIHVAITTSKSKRDKEESK